MHRALVPTAALLGAASLCACGTPQARLTYSSLPAEGANGSGYPFVVPRTVVKVAPTLDKNNEVDSVAFSSVPVATAKGNTPLPAFLATDSSTSGWALTQTSVSSVSYVDDLIINVVGTQVTDNRNDLVSAIVGAAGLAGAFAGSACDDKALFKSFVIEDFRVGSALLVPGSTCWRYKIAQGPNAANSMKAELLSALPSTAAVSWFPIPACTSYVITVARCSNASCTEDKAGSQTYSTTVSVSDGLKFRKTPLPTKGKITMHTDFCGADTTNDGGGTTNWAVVKELISDVKAAKK